MDYTTSDDTAGASSPEPTGVRARLPDGRYQPMVDFVRWRLAQADSAVRPVDLVITPNEISFAHGTGVLMTRILQEAGDYVLLRAFDHYGGRQNVHPLADFVYHRYSTSRAQIGNFVVNRLVSYDVQRIMVVTYTREDVIMALTAKALTGAPLCVYVMDDNVLNNDGIPRVLFEELLRVADVKFVISSTMRDAYESAFRHKFWVLPPVVAGKFIRKAPSKQPRIEVDAPHRAVIVGNIWHQGWLDGMLDVLAGRKTKVTWYASSGDLYWLNLDKGKLKRAGVEIRANVPHDEIARGIEEAHFVLVPSGNACETDGHAAAISRLSLPSKMPFVTASAGTPFLVLTSGSGAGDYVHRFDLGEVILYDGEAYSAAVKRLCEPTMQKLFRDRSFAIGSTFNATGVYRLLSEAAEAKGRLPDDRFEKMFGPAKGEFKYYVKNPVPAATIIDEQELVQALERLSSAGYSPDFFLDIGASTGIWSTMASLVYPDCPYFLADPLASRYPHRKEQPNFTWVEAAVADRSGTAIFKVSADGYNSSLFKVSDVSEQIEEISVKLTTVDDIVEMYKPAGRCILKIDVQFAEHLVIAGAAGVLRDQADFVILELTLHETAPGTKAFTEMVQIMGDLNFIPFDEVGEWRSPQTGFLQQKDVMFGRRDLVNAMMAT